MSLIPEGVAAAATEPVAGTPTEPVVAPSFNFSELHEGGVYKEGVDWAKALEPLGLQDQHGLFSKYKNVGETLKGMGGLSKLAGGKAEGLKYPSDPEDAAAVAAWRAGVGAPETVEGYNLDAPEELPEGMDWNREMAGEYANVLHKHHASPALVSELLSLNTKLAVEQHNLQNVDSTNAEAAALEEQSKLLTAEYGASLPGVMAKAARAAIAADLDPASSLFNTAANVKAFAKYADLIGEDNLPMNTADVHQTAQHEADAIMKDSNHPDNAAYYAGDKAVFAKVSTLLERAARAG